MNRKISYINRAMCDLDIEYIYLNDKYFAAFGIDATHIPEYCLNKGVSDHGICVRLYTPWRNSLDKCVECRYFKGEKFVYERYPILDDIADDIFIHLVLLVAKEAITGAVKHDADQKAEKLCKEFDEGLRQRLLDKLYDEEID